MEKDWVHLQGVGKVLAKQIKDFKVGEKLGYNYGSTAKILSRRVKGKSIRLKIQTNDGKIYNVVKRANTLWARG